MFGTTGTLHHAHHPQPSATVQHCCRCCKLIQWAGISLGASLGRRRCKERVQSRAGHFGRSNGNVAQDLTIYGVSATNSKHSTRSYDATWYEYPPVCFIAVSRLHQPPTKSTIPPPLVPLPVRMPVGHCNAAKTHNESIY